MNQEDAHSLCEQPDSKKCLCLLGEVNPSCHLHGVPTAEPDSGIQEQKKVCPKCGLFGCHRMNCPDYDSGKSEAPADNVSAVIQNATNMNSPTTIETWMLEARQLAAQCWCDPETSDRVMDVALAEAVARRIAAWMDSAAMFSRNSDFYQGIVVQIGKMFGKPAYISDDGSVQQDILALRVPELVRQLLSEHRSGSDASGVAAKEEGEFRRIMRSITRPPIVNRPYSKNTPSPSSTEQKGL